MACHESNALSVQLREHMKDFCERGGVALLSRTQFEARPRDEGLMMAMSASCTNQPGDTVDDLVAQFANNLEHHGLNEDTTAIYCSMLIERSATATSPVAHYQARVYQFS